MDAEDVQKLLDIYEQYNSGSNEKDLLEFGSKLTKEDIESILQISISKNLSPDVILNAVFESIEDSDLTKKVIMMAIKQIQKWNFASADKACQFTRALCKMIPQVASLKTAIQIIKHAYRTSIKTKDDEKRPYIIESLLSIIPLAFQKLYNKQDVIKIKEVEQTCQEHCQSWINEVLQSEIPDYVAPSLVDTFTELPLTEEQTEKLVKNILSSACFHNISIIARRLFPAIQKYPKVTYQCLKRLIKIALEIEKADYEGENIENVRAQCSLIKTLYAVSNTFRTVLECLTKILTSPNELPTHFTPFLISLTFDVSRLNTKIKDSTQKFYNEQIKNDYIRVRSRFLNHIFLTEPTFEKVRSLEYAMTYAINLSHVNLETNAHNFIEFAFNLIDNSKDNSGFRKAPTTCKIVESSSQFISESVRQIELGVKILEKCLEDFTSSKSEIFGQIVQRLISNSPNSAYLVQCLDSPEHLLEVIDYLQYLELPVVEQLMRYAVPKIYGNEIYLDRAIMDARKAFFNRTERAKLNGVAALFYLIMPRQERTFTQTMSNHDFGSMFNGSFVDAAANEDTQHDIFNLMRRGFTQSDIVQADIYFFIPFLLQKSPELSSTINDSFIEKLESITRIDPKQSVKKEEDITLGTVKTENGETENEHKKVFAVDGFYEGFPLTINASIPHFLHCLSQCLRILPDNIKQSDEWTSISNTLNTLCDEVSKVDFDYLYDSMDIFQHPDERECIITIISVLFNHSFLIDKDVALSLFRLYDRIIHKKAEIGKMRKDELKSELKFPRFMDLSVLEELFKKLEEENGDYSDNYGIQLYALENAKDMISELSVLRLEMRGERIKRVMTLGQILYDSYENVKWMESPAGFKTNLSLQDLLTTSLKQLFTFAFETYEEKYVKKFMQKMALIKPDEQISDANGLILKKIKWNLSHQYAKSVDNFCCIAEMVSMLSTKDITNFKTIKKMLTNLIRTNSPSSGRILKLARYYCSFNLEWLGEFAQMIAEKATLNEGEEDNNSSYSPALLEVISTLGVYLDDIDWAVKIWLPQVNAENCENSKHFGEKISIFLLQMTEITEILIKIDFKPFPHNYYESFIKFVNEFYKMLNRLLKQTLDVPDSSNDALEGLVRKITSEFDEEVINFTIANQINQKTKYKRHEKFDATYAPQLHFNIDRLRALVKTLVEKGLLIKNILEDFCKLRGTDVKFPKKMKKKKKEMIEDEEPVQQEEANNTNNEEQIETEYGDIVNYNVNGNENENENEIDDNNNEEDGDSVG